MSGKTEKTLRKLFDYQKFGKDPRLEQMIKAAEGITEELPDEDLSFVSAAGEITLGPTYQTRIRTDYQLDDEQ